MRVRIIQSPETYNTGQPWQVQSQTWLELLTGSWTDEQKFFGANSYADALDYAKRLKNPITREIK